ncbi:hypothetical protein [Roseinatronobacter sp. NSM]|uniref:hypothetical protein n=1 Tax=Roseinatronobacter sp. NSM TaxID=3457785 RepID=UPI004036533A
MPRCPRPNRLRIFLVCEAGAVSVDWVVLSAAAIGLGAFFVTQVSEGSATLANATQSSLQDMLAEDPVARYMIQRLDEAQVASWTATFAAQTDTQLLGSVQTRHDQFMSHLAAQQWSQALQRIDYYHIIEEELATRGLQRPEGMPTAQTMFDLYTSARS